jgi:hypothetical protein
MPKRVLRTKAALLLLGLVALGRTLLLAGEAAATRPDFSGRWTYNVTLSDDARQAMYEAVDRDRLRGLGPAGGVPLGPAGSGMLEPVFEPADELTITQSAVEVVIDESYGRRRALHTDGKKHKTENGTAELKAEWRQDRLLVETRDRAGQKLVESWQLSASRERLIVEVKVEGRIGPKLLLKRVYERARAAP